jgi:integrase
MKKPSHLVTNLNPQTVGPVLTPAAAARLLKNCNDPLATLSLALQLFGGLHHSEIENLKWRTSFAYRGCIDTFRVHHQAGIPMQCYRTVQMLVVLEPWLEPFRLRTDTLCFDESVRNHAAEALRAAGIENAATLRHTYIAYMLPQIAGIADWVRYCSIEREDILNRMIPSLSKEDVKLMFELTPKKVGIRNWPQRVARAMESLKTGS